MPTDLSCNVVAQSAVAVSKRKFKRAVHRNLLKRRIREAFRLNKVLLYEQLEARNAQLALLIVYNHNKILKYSDIEKSLVLIINDISGLLSTDSWLNQYKEK